MGEIFRTLITDLSKNFDGISHVLLVNKLNAYGFTLPALKLIYNCLGNQKQRTKLTSHIARGIAGRVCQETFSIVLHQPNDGTHLILSKRSVLKSVWANISHDTAFGVKTDQQKN